MDYYDTKNYTDYPTIYHIVDGKGTFLDWQYETIRKQRFSNKTKYEIIKFYEMIPFTLPMLLKKYSPLWSHEPAKKFIRDYLIALAKESY